MAKSSVTIRAAWITGSFAIVAAIVAGIFLLIKPDNRPNITNKGSGQQIVGDNNIISVNTPITPKKAYLSILDETDIHLGDNIYPDTFGVSYNPLTHNIYPQPLDGVVYFDKKEKTFLPDKAGPTQIGQYLVNKISPQIMNIDFTSYLYTYAVNKGDIQYQSLIKKYAGSNQIAHLGPTALIASTDFKGNFYHRYAAVGFAKSFSLVSSLQHSGITQKQNNLNATIVIKSYHGGIRPGQKENFFLQVNEYFTEIPSRTRSMRLPAESSIDVPIKYLYFDRPNYIFVYVLPWVEAGPVLKLGQKRIHPAHFRDIGIINMGIYIKEV